jgi:transketolase
VLRAARTEQQARGTVVVQGTSSTANLVKVLPDLDRLGLNVKVVAAISPQLFRLQSREYQDEVLSLADRLDSMAITNRGRRLMHDWLGGPISEEYTLSSDFDDRWRTGGTLDEVIEEAQLDPKHILEGIERFVEDREKRLARLRLATRAD